MAKYCEDGKTIRERRREYAPLVQTVATVKATVANNRGLLKENREVSRHSCMGKSDVKFEK
jgi:hypothetical protein